MSSGSFVFSATALRSLRRDQDALERDASRRQQLASQRLSRYLLHRDRAPLGAGPARPPPPALCKDAVVQNALYTGDLQALQQLFPAGASANLTVEPQGGELLWRPSGEVKFRKTKKYREDVIATATATGSVLQFWNALLVGDELTAIGIMDDEELGYLIDAIYDTSNIEEWKSFRFNYRGLRLWSLTYEQELTTPLHITAGRGFSDCLRHLLQRGAEVDRAPGGTTALHESCQSCQPECTKLLLLHGANANAVSEDGLMPLHVCTCPQSLECARYLLQYGAAVGGRSLEEDDTPLHVAAQNGLPGHVDLFLRHGAAVDKRNHEGLTALNAACSQPQEPRDLPSYFQVCRLLVEAGAAVRTMDQDRRTPLHMACKSANPDVVELLLASGASVNEMDYGGEAPLHNILKVVCFKADHQPERIVRALLNHGSIRVWPGALPKVLQYCAVSPPTIEVLLNAYSRLKVTDAWRDAVPAEVLQEHTYFYESVFALQGAPRSLQHLARCRLRSLVEGRVHQVVPKLDLPTFIRNYLLLHHRGYVH